MCTSTLAAGVNLPAGRVIINGMKIGYSGMLNVIQYRQMCGRAGRAGLSTCAAESYLLVRPSEKNAAMALATAPYPSVVSQMSPHTIEGNKGFLRAILELCSLSLCDSTSTFKLYVEQTLFFREFALNGVVNTGKITLSKPPEQAFRALQFLLNARILKVLSLTAVLPAVPHSTVDHFPDFEFGLTQFGTACVACNMNPDDAIVFYEDLLRAREYLNLENDLHVAYLCSPLYHSLLPNFSAIFNTMTCGDEATPMKRVMAALELEEGLLMKWMHAPPSTAIVQSAADTLRQLKSSSGLLFNGHPGVVKTTLKVNEKEISMICRCKRLWAAQILADMLRSQDALLVAKRYGVPVGDLEQLHKNATMLSAKMVEFAAKLGWTSLSQIMKNFCPRLKKIDNSDPSCTLVDLMSVPGLDIRTAKLFSCSKLFDSCKKIADAQTKDVAQYLRLSFSFDVSGLVSSCYVIVTFPNYAANFTASWP